MKINYTELFLHPRFCDNGTVEYEGWCPTIWSDYTCWQSTPPGELSVQECPNYDAPIDGVASKRCLENGTWLFNWDQMEEYTNYTLCNVLTSEERFLKHLLEFQPYIPHLKKMSLVVHSFSIVALIVALVILLSFRSLRCSRNQLHVHLFLSFIFRSVTFILRTIVYEPTAEMLQTSDMFDQILCKSLTAIWQYCIMANHFWIAVEGFYICYVMIKTFSVIHDSVICFILAGWGVPGLFTISWAILKKFYEDTYCWTINDIAWIVKFFNFSVSAIVFTNFIFFCYMIYVLCSKMRAAHKRYLGLARSISVLIPLFAAHYLVFNVFQYTPKYEDKYWLLAFLFIDMFFTSFQGFLVALILCFMNSEVRREVRLWFRSLSYMQETAPASEHGFRALCRRYFSPFFMRARHSEGNTQDNEAGEQFEGMIDRQDDGNASDSSEGANMLYQAPTVMQRILGNTRFWRPPQINPNARQEVATIELTVLNNNNNNNNNSSINKQNRPIKSKDNERQVEVAAYINFGMIIDDEDEESEEEEEESNERTPLNSSDGRR